MTKIEMPEPVAYMHDSIGRYDVIHTKVKALLIASGGYLHRPLDKAEHYTLPLYTAEAMQQYARDVLEQAAEVCENGFRFALDGDVLADKIRAMIGEIK